MNIVEQIRRIPALYHAQGCTQGQLQQAQRELNIVFPEEFADYVREFGAISFGENEWTGLNVQGYLNVVEATMRERARSAAFPKDCFVIENDGIDGLITAVNGAGEVYSICYDQKERICGSLGEYLALCAAGK